jgi:hypothetical protein
VRDDCTWKMSGECDGPAIYRDLFFGGEYIKVPICDKHYVQHGDLISVYKKVKDLNEALKKDRLTKFDPIVLMLEEMKFCVNDAKELVKKSECLNKKCAV